MKRGIRSLNRIDVLIAVDVTGALAAGTLQGFVYLADTNKYLGSWQEGQSTLNTVCQDGQLVTWSVTSIDPGAEVTIAGYSGAMVDAGICRPAPAQNAGDVVWSGMVESKGTFAGYAYTAALALGGTQLSFSATLKVV